MFRFQAQGCQGLGLGFLGLGLGWLRFRVLRVEVLVFGVYI